MRKDGRSATSDGVDDAVETYDVVLLQEAEIEPELRLEVSRALEYRADRFKQLERYDEELESRRQIVQRDAGSADPEVRAAVLHALADAGDAFGRLGRKIVMRAEFVNELVPRIDRAVSAVVQRRDILSGLATASVAAAAAWAHRRGRRR